MTEVLEINETNYSELATFLATFPNDGNSELFWQNRFRLWWENNPSFAAGSVRGWVLRGHDEQIKGFLGNVPRQFRVAGSDHRSSSSTTWRVLPDYRGSSIRLVNAHINASEGTLIFNTTLNATAAKVYEFLRFGSVASAHSQRTFILPIDAAKAAHAYLRDQNRSAMFSQLMATGLKIAGLPSSLHFMSRRSSSVRALQHAGVEFDDLWERTQNQVRYTSVRTAAQINWICFGDPNQKKTLLGYYEDNRLAGFAIFCDAIWRGARVFELFDIWAEYPGNRAISALLSASYRHARAHHYELLAFHDYSKQLTRLLRGCGLFLTVPDNRRHFFGAAEAIPSDFQPENYYLSGIEGDLGL